MERRGFSLYTTPAPAFPAWHGAQDCRWDVLGRVVNRVVEAVRDALCSVRPEAIMVRASDRIPVNDRCRDPLVAPVPARKGRRP